MFNWEAIQILTIQFVRQVLLHLWGLGLSSLVRLHLRGHSQIEWAIPAIPFDGPFTHTHTHSHLNERTGSFSLWMTPRTSAIALVRTSPHKCDCTCAQKRNILTCHYQRYCTGWWRPIGCLKSQIIFRKRTFIIGLFCGKWPVNIRHPMTLRHPVSIVSNRSIAMELTCQHSPWWLSLWSCLATISIFKFSQVSSIATITWRVVTNQFDIYFIVQVVSFPYLL